MSSKLRGIKRGQQKKDPMVLAIVDDGSGVFGPEHCKFVPKSVAEKEGYVYVEGKTPEQLYRNMMKMVNDEEK